MSTPTFRNDGAKNGISNNGGNEEQHALLQGGDGGGQVGGKTPPNTGKGDESGGGPTSSSSLGTGGTGSSKVAFACLLYSFCSICMVLVNKSLASSYNHLIDGDLNVLLVVFQAIVAVICVEFSRRTGIIESYTFSLSIAKKWAPVNLFFCGMLFTGMASLQHNTVPMVTVFKNIANICTTIGEWYFFGNAPECLVLAAFGVMLAGACLAAMNDITITTTGIFWMSANCLCTSGYVLYMKFATKTIQMSKFGMVFYNNLLCICFLVPVAYLWGEIDIFLKTDVIHTWDYFTKNVFAGFVGFFLNFASLNCVQATGPTTYAIIGSLNKIPTSFIGWFMFKTVITPKTWFFIGVSMVGGFMYSYAKIRSNGRSSAPAARGGGSRQTTSSWPESVLAWLNGDYTRDYAQRVLLVCAIYMAAYVTYGTAARFATRFGDPDVNIVVLPFVAQSVIGLAVHEVAKCTKLIENFNVDLSTLKLWIPVSILHLAMLVTGIGAMGHVSSTVMVVAKTLTNIIICDGDTYVFGTSSNHMVSAALGVMLVGACLSAMQEIDFDMRGLIWMGGNCVATAAYVLYLSHVVRTVKIPKLGMIYYSSVLSLLVLVPFAFIRGEVEIFMSTRSLHTQVNIGTGIGVAFLGVLTTLAGLGCIQSSGPTTFAVMGSLSKVPMAILAYFLFGADITSQACFFLVLTCLAGFIFFQARMVEASSSSHAACGQLGTSGTTPGNPSVEIATVDRGMYGRDVVTRHEWQPVAAQQFRDLEAHR